MDALWQDLRYAVRTLTRSRGFAAVAILVLGLGIGVNTAIFSIVNAVLLRPLPITEPNRLVWIYGYNPAGDEGTQLGNVAYGDYLLLKEIENEALQEVAAFGGERAKLGIDGERAFLRGERVSANYFRLLGVRPILGRAFMPEEDRRDSSPVVVISHQLWRNRFQENPSVLGSRIRLDAVNHSGRGRAYTVVGVAPPGFKGISDPWDATEFWVPTAQRAVDYEVWCEPRFLGDGILFIVARLRPDATHEQAQKDIVEAVPVLLQENAKSTPEFSKGWGLVARETKRSSRLPFGSGSAQVVPERLALGLMAVSGILLLIAGANLTGVLMARGVKRRGEIAVRLALGAGRARVVGQILAESMLLAVAGGTVGIWLSQGLIKLFLAAGPSQSGAFGSIRFVEVPLDLNVVSFTVAVCVGVALLVSLAPARQASRTSPLVVLAGDHVAASRYQRSLLRYWIVVPQICLALALLLVSGVVVRGLLRAELAGLGYHPESIVFVDYRVAQPTLCERNQGQTVLASWRESRRRIDRTLLEKSRHIASVRGVSVIGDVARGQVESRLHSWVAANESNPEETVHLWVNGAMVSPGYFEVVDVPLRGRDFGAEDTNQSPRVAIVSEVLAEQLWPGKQAIGETLTFHEPGKPASTMPYAVIGIVKETKPALGDGKVTPMVYTVLDQSVVGSAVLLKGDRSPAELIKDVSEVIRSTDLDAEVIKSGTLIDAIDELRYPRRMAAAILTTAGLVGMLLASVGLYGVVSFSVAQRVKEIGIRAALGAGEVDILRLVLGEGLKVILIGSAIGLALGLAAIRLASATVVAFPTMDVLTLVAVPLFLAMVVLAACWVPARRAARVDPMVALREL